MDLLTAMWTALTVAGVGIWLWGWKRSPGLHTYNNLYDIAAPFSEGLAAVKKGGECFHIYLDGSRAYLESYDQVGNFSKGVAWVRKGKKWLQIRSDGSRVLPL